MNATTANELLSVAWQASTNNGGSGAPTPLALPAIDRGWRYGWHALGGALVSRLKGHRLQPQRAGCYSSHVHLDDGLRSTWHDLASTSWHSLWRRIPKSARSGSA